jgi:AcrR family transcriptional regulator
MRRSHRDQLLEGAIKCLEDKGYARTTARDVAAASDANLASIGYHFGSKERLLNSALIEAFRRWMAPLLVDVTVRDGRALWDLLVAGITAFIRTLEADRAMVVLFFESLAQSARSSELREEIARGYDSLRERFAVQTLAAGIASDRRQALALASSLVALFDGVMVQWLINPAGVPAAEQLLSALGAWMSEAATDSR